MTRIAWLIAAAILPSCGELGDTYQYMARFCSHLSGPCGSRIEIVETMPVGTAANVVGICFSDNHIVVEKQFWDSSDDLMREQVIFHEMGHCVLHRAHTTDFSIMQPTLHSAYTYKMSHEQLIQELFK